MDRSEFRHNDLLYTEEPVSEYRSGGYHPVRVGDWFKGSRYQVRHKLGWGYTSTVWLARDRKRNRWVALKILTADYTRITQEIHTLRDLRRSAGGHLYEEHIVQLLDDFRHRGPNGRHFCLVFEILGPVLQDILEMYRINDMELDATTVTRISQQLMGAVKFIHSTGRCHGDVSPKNIAFTFQGLNNRRQDQINKIVGHPPIAPLDRVDGQPLEKGQPPYLVQRLDWHKWGKEEYEDIRLLDFGECFQQGEEPESLAQSSILRVPETLLSDSFDYRVDLWRTGLVMCCLLYRSSPFSYHGSYAPYVAQMIGFVDQEMPAEWEAVWTTMKDSFGRDEMDVLETAERKKWVTLPDGGSISGLAGMFNKSQCNPTLKPVMQAIHGLMRLLPSNRITIDEALDFVGQANNDGAPPSHTDHC